MIGRALALLGAGWLVLHHLGRTQGATRDERRRPLPGDRFVLRPQTTATHAATIEAPPAEVWPWLVQVGWHRGGWYTPRWVDTLLFPANLPSADEVRPELQHLEVGSFIPDGPPESECGFVVRELEPAERLVLQSDSHLPLAWRCQGCAAVDWTWSFVLTPDADGTRVLFRWRAHTRPWWLTVAAHMFVVPADLLMSWSMLRGLNRRACRTSKC